MRVQNPLSCMQPELARWHLESFGGDGCLHGQLGSAAVLELAALRTGHQPGRLLHGCSTANTDHSLHGTANATGAYLTCTLHV